MARSAATVRRMLHTLLFVAVVAGATLGVANPPASAQERDGLQVSSSKTFTPDLEDEHIEVEATYTMTNRQSDEIIGDSVRSFYYTSWVVALPATVTDFRATSSGTTLNVALNPDPDTEDIIFATISLPFNLDFGQTVTVNVDYIIPGGEPREGAVARVNDSFLSFSVWAAGDAGATDVRINVPDGFTFDLQGALDELQPASEDGDIFYEAVDIAEPRQFFGRIFGRNDNGLITETANLSNATATVRGWPDDPDWAAFVVDAIEDDVPIIEELTGLSWPAGDIEVIETVTPYLYGYGGWFNASSGLIEIGENLERDLILHELTHAWFNEDLIEGRWITEGLAEEYASRTIAATGDVQPDPEQPDINDELRVPLAAWASPWSLNQDQAYAYEQFHYNASWWVIRQITDDIGLDSFADVLGALARDELPYRGEGPIEQTQLPTRWTHLFDLLDRGEGAEGLDELFTTYVLSRNDAEKLDERRTTLLAYDALLDAADTWGPPLGVRRDLSAWDFDDAVEQIEAATGIIGQRDTVDQLALDLNVAIEHTAETQFEAALSVEDLGVVQDVETMLEQQLLDLQDERARVRQMAAELETTVVFPQMSLAEAFGDVAARDMSIAEAGLLRAAVSAAAADLGLASPTWPTGAGPTDFDADAALAEARLATLKMLADTTAVVDAPRSLTQRVGLWFSDVDATLSAARAHFESDELNTALETSATTQSLISQAAIVGRNRMLWALAIAVAAVASVLFVRATNQRSLRREASKQK